MTRKYIRNPYPFHNNDVISGEYNRNINAAKKDRKWMPVVLYIMTACVLYALIRSAAS